MSANRNGVSAAKKTKKLPELSFDDKTLNNNIEQLLEALLSQLDEGAVTINSQGHICFSNQQGCVLIGKQLSELKGQIIDGYLPVNFQDVVKYIEQNENDPEADPIVSQWHQNQLVTKIIPISRLIENHREYLAILIFHLRTSNDGPEFSKQQLLQYARDFMQLYHEEKQARQRLEQANADLIRAADERARLITELRDKETRLRWYVQRLITSQEEERKRVAADVHDGVAQMIVGVHQRIQACLGLIKEGPAVDLLMAASALAKETSQEARRLLGDLRPPLLDDFGLVPALQKYLVATAVQEGWEPEFESSGGPPPLDPSSETAVFRIFQEILTNIRKHSQATKVKAEVHTGDEEITLCVTDNGAGFDTSILSKKTDGAHHIGIHGMRERVELLAGQLNISSKPGQGTKIEVVVPLNAREQKEV